MGSHRPLSFEEAQPNPNGCSFQMGIKKHQFVLEHGGRLVCVKRAPADRPRIAGARRASSSDCYGEVGLVDPSRTSGSPLAHL